MMNMFWIKIVHGKVIKLEKNKDFDMNQTFPLELSGQENEPLLPQWFLPPIKSIFIVLSSTFTRLYPVHRSVKGCP